MKNFLYAMLGAVASGIAFILGIVGFTAVTSRMVFIFLFRYMREIATFFFLSSIWGMAGFPLFLINPWVGLIFLIAGPLFGPQDERGEPQNPFYRVITFLGAFLPPWALYSLGHYRTFWGITIALAVVKVFAPQSIGQAYGAAVLGSLWLVLLSVRSLRKGILLTSISIFALTLIVKNPAIAGDMAQNLFFRLLSLIWWAVLNFGLPVVTGLVWRYARKGGHETAEKYASFVAILVFPPLGAYTAGADRFHLGGNLAFSLIFRGFGIWWWLLLRPLAMCHAIFFWDREYNSQRLTAKVMSFL